MQAVTRFADSASFGRTIAGQTSAVVSCGARDKSWAPMTDHPREDMIEMERRHIREGEARIVRQETIAKHLGSHGRSDLATQARDLLTVYREIVAFAKERLTELEQRRNRTPPT